MLSYKEQLQHPNWQRKRLEILERDNFTCVYCGSNDKQLQVHHLLYFKDSLCWEYPNYCLITLCNECHEVESIEKRTNLLALFLLNKISTLTQLNIQKLDIEFEYMDVLEGRDNYTKNEAFKIVILKLIAES